MQRGTDHRQGHLDGPGPRQDKLCGAGGLHPHTQGKIEQPRTCTSSVIVQAVGGCADNPEMWKQNTHQRIVEGWCQGKQQCEVRPTVAQFGVSWGDTHPMMTSLGQLLPQGQEPLADLELWRGEPILFSLLIQSL